MPAFSRFADSGEDDSDLASDTDDSEGYESDEFSDTEDPSAHLGEQRCHW